MQLIKAILRNRASVIRICILTLVIAGCQAPKLVQREEPPLPLPPPKPAKVFSINVGSIDLSSFPRKIEKSDIRKFAAQLKKDSLDILTVQGITRYPDLGTRIDIVDEMTAASEMTAAFGETITLSGRQSGNAVFSHYPIRSYESTQYPRLRSARFESALQAIIDCGERELVVISTQLPDKTTPDEQASIVSTLGGFSTYYVNRPLIIGGNLLILKTLRTLTTYNTAKNDNDKSLPKIWYSNEGPLRLVNSKAVETALGKMFCVRFNISPPSQP